MNKTLDDYRDYMGYFPTYGCPDKLEDDEEFEYYKFKIPRHYIRGVLAEGDVWLGYEECEEEGTLDSSIILGMRYLPVYVGIEYLGADVDFLYYKIKTPKMILDSPIIPGGSVNHRIAYEYVEDWEKEKEEKKDTLPVAGEAMSGRHDEQSVKKVKENIVLLYEITLKCNNPDCSTSEYKEVTSDLWDAVHGITCSECFGTEFSLIGYKVLVEEEEGE